MQWYMPAICGFAEQAGFPHAMLGDAVALAWATSGGYDGYHHSAGEPPGYDYRGLWGIDVVEWASYGYRDLYDPRQCARVAAALTRDHGDTLRWSPVWRGGIDPALKVDADRVVTSGLRADPLATAVSDTLGQQRLAAQIRNAAEHARAGLAGPIKGI